MHCVVPAGGARCAHTQRIKGTGNDTFLEFVTDVLLPELNDGKQYTILMDNLSSHRQQVGGVAWVQTSNCWRMNATHACARQHPDLVALRRQYNIPPDTCMHSFWNHADCSACC